jgi:endonuclease/exonuclease/phosphatase family metal-dependent hydrolase
MSVGSRRCGPALPGTRGAVLAEQLGMHWAWTPSPVPERWQRRIGDPTMQVGNAILSRWPIATHLTSTVGQSELRCRQVAALCRFVAAHTGPGLPPVVTGDLNAGPDADEVRLLGGHKTAPVVPGLVLVDAWSYADPLTSGWTWDRRNPYVAATGEPSARIDYVLVGLPAASGAGQVRSVRLIGGRPVNGSWPSEHRAQPR